MDIAMSLCASCGLQLSGAAGLCPHHHRVPYDEGWAAASRIMCDLIHRKKVPPRLSFADRDDDDWAPYVIEVASAGTRLLD
jgi:hypothetical protein